MNFCHERFRLDISGLLHHRGLPHVARSFHQGKASEGGAREGERERQREKSERVREGERQRNRERES